LNYTFKTKGVCASLISFDMDENNAVTNIKFEDGCDGNLKMLTKLFDGKGADEIISLCKGNTCDTRKASCADQLSIAIEGALSGKGQSILS